ncbi:hypothetical protein BKA61DRAFT_720880 [Leptodontidium sp. MPI-SDFR-AT-0119]|nr:hypothetical protein BKA61DRAFT_720880 [Leptodontidium sp. MPI-SDFR-AT-0119]
MIVLKDFESGRKSQVQTRTLVREGGAGEVIRKVDSTKKLPHGPDARLVALCRVYCVWSRIRTMGPFLSPPFGVYQQAQLVYGVRFSAPLDPIVATNITIAVAQTTIEMAARRLTSLRRKSVGTHGSAFLGRVGLESLWSRHASAVNNGDRKPLEPKLNIGEQRMDF